MFKFFEGALGEMLAPVSGTSNVFFLAIQHHKNEEVKSLLLNSADVDMARISENGYSAIHCACRYNNVIAINLLLSRGVTVDFIDGAGNTPLHYAAKYGHQDLCRLLVGKNAFPGKRNEKGETPYDVSESHTVRQYLLPLQFQCERNPSGHGSTDSGDNISMASVQISNANPISNKNSTQIQYSNYSASNQAPVPYDISAQQSPTLIPNCLTVHPYTHGATPQNTSPSKYQGVPSSIFPDEKRDESRVVGNNQIGQGYEKGKGGQLQLNEINSIEQSSVPKAFPLMRSNSIPPVSNTMGNIVPPSAASMSRSGPVILNQNPNTPIFNASISSLSQQHRTLNVNNLDINVEKVPPYFVNQKNLNSSTAPATVSGLPAGIPNNIPPPGYVTGQSPSIGPPVQSVYRPSSTAPSSSNHRIFQPDGFHTSASDPELQKKYGHTRNVIDIAPPPTFSSLTPPEGAPNQYNMYSSQYVPNGGPASSGSAPPAYNRYVAYDPYAPSQQQQSSVQLNGQQQPLGQHQPQQQPPKQTPSIAVLGFSMPSMSFARSSSYGLPIAQSQSKSFPSTSSHTQASEFPYSQGHEVSGSKHLSENGGSALQMNHSAFDPIADSDVEILDSHSSSVL